MCVAIFLAIDKNSLKNVKEGQAENIMMRGLVCLEIAVDFVVGAVFRFLCSFFFV